MSLKTISKFSIWISFNLSTQGVSMLGKPGKIRAVCINKKITIIFNFRDIFELPGYSGFWLSGFRICGLSGHQVSGTVVQLQKTLIFFSYNIVRRSYFFYYKFLKEEEDRGSTGNGEKIENGVGARTLTASCRRRKAKKCLQRW